MWQRKKRTTPQKRIDSLIGAGTVVNGNVTFAGGLRIDGKVHGNVIAAHRRTEHARDRRAGGSRRRDPGVARRDQRQGRRAR